MRLLACLTGLYAVTYTLLLILMVPGTRWQRRRFETEFGSAKSPDALEGLSATERDRWDEIWRSEYRKSFFGKLEILFMFFNYPSVIVYGAILGRENFGGWSVIFVNGAFYVSVFYFILRHRYFV